MKFAADFESFLIASVNLNQSRLDTLQQKVDAIESFVEADATFSDMFLDMIPAGSWAHRMIIKPVCEDDEFDADILLYVEEQDDWLPKDYIEKLYSSFHNSAVYGSIALRKTRCVRIDYKGDFHVDVVPYLERGGSHVITNRLEPKDEGRFEVSDPEAFSEWIDERQRVSSGTFIKVVRLIKYLRDYKNTFTCVSIILTTLLGNEVNEIEASFSPALYADVPSALVTVLGKLASSLPSTMPAVMDPAGTGDNFTDRYGNSWNYENFRDCMILYADKAKKAYDETDRETAIKLWREIFGDDFKPGELESAAKMAPLSAAVPAPKEEFIDRDRGFAIAMVPEAKVRIVGRCTGFNDGKFSRRHGFRKFALASKGNRVPKYRDLCFDATTNVSKPYELYWKVRNGGEEAARLEQLRGEISQDAGRSSKVETTKYKGSHYVECYVVKNRVVVAVDRQTVIVS
jgi:hypothetical protein